MVLTPPPLTFLKKLNKSLMKTDSKSKVTKSMLPKNKLEKKELSESELFKIQSKDPQLIQLKTKLKD